MTDVADIGFGSAVACWAVFSGCEGDDPTLVAIFFGKGAKETAEAFSEEAGKLYRGNDHDADGPLALCDPQPAPVILGSAEIFACDDYDDVRAARDLIASRSDHDHLTVEAFGFGETGVDS